MFENIITDFNRCASGLTNTETQRRSHWCPDARKTLQTYTACYTDGMSTSTIDTTELSILTRAIAPQAPTLSPLVAEEVLKWGFSDEDRERMSELAAKARLGSLDADEAAAIDSYERVSSFLGLVKSKARRSLNAVSGQ